jgi:kynurenine formamidase
MRLIDLSQPLYDDVPNCPDHPPVQINNVVAHPEGGWQLEMLTLVSHTGSHVDTPLHRLAAGKNLDDLPLETWVGDAYIADLRGLVSDGTAIESCHLADCLPWEKDSANDPVHGTIVLLATGYGRIKAVDSERWARHSPYLSPEGAAYLVGRGIRGVGIDHYSIGGTIPHVNEETHELLLGAGIWIVEELHFPDEVFSLGTPVEFWSLPINLRGGSGMFCRPVIVIR